MLPPRLTVGAAEPSAPTNSQRPITPPDGDHPAPTPSPSGQDAEGAATRAAMLYSNRSMGAVEGPSGNGRSVGLPVPAKAKHAHRQWLPSSDRCSTVSRGSPVLPTKG
jgi:hypothetical protein